MWRSGCEEASPLATTISIEQVRTWYDEWELTRGVDVHASDLVDMALVESLLLRVQVVDDGDSADEVHERSAAVLVFLREFLLLTAGEDHLLSDVLWDQDVESLLFSWDLLRLTFIILVNLVVEGSQVGLLSSTWSTKLGSPPQPGRRG